MNLVEYDKLENLPSLKTGWVRLVHRLVAGDGRNVQSIKTNGLVFNREAAKCGPHQKGGSYNHVTSMVSVYDEDTFWQSMQKDNFACFNDDKTADTKLVFDVPMEEFCFLQSYGRKVKGRIDNKYLVGCIQNVNALNLQLKMPVSEVLRAEKISRANLPINVIPNNVKTMINHLIMQLPKEKRQENTEKIYAKMNTWKDDVLEFFADEKKMFVFSCFAKTNEGR